MSRRVVVPDVPVADVCLLLEGTWPYVRGGVSSWINQMILGLPEITFSVFFIGGQREAYPRRNYEIPANVVHIEEVFLEESWSTGVTAKGTVRKGPADVLENLYRYFHHPDQPDIQVGEALLDAFAEGRIELADVLHSRAAWEVVSEGYRRHCSDPSFINYFWTLRTMQSPLLMLAAAARRMPRARSLHAISTGYAGLMGCILKRLWNCSFVLSEHGIYTKERKIDLAQAGWIAENPDEALSSSLDTGTGYIRTLWIRFFERIGLLVYGSADPVIALYDGNRQRQIKDGADPARTRVIPNGIDLQRWSEVLAARPEGIAPVVGLIGRVVPIKDVKTFIRSLRGVISAMPEAEGWIVGPEDEDADYAAECHSLVSSLGLEGKVHFLGFQRIQDILPKLGLMVLTSISEAQPLVILEAWCAGTPVVSSDVGSCRELIEGGDAEDRALGQAGEVVAIADPQATARAILELLRDPQRWKSAQAAGLARVHRYYGEALMLQRYRDLYRAATENN
ncbi:GT4 family glycosyltransferase PelF [Pseudomonas mangrovi]|uniref:Glycosyl transferase family 1 n=1 Tax=Pseudomonas mangrovi TaxID=2161748 RepID=A0A2T5P703_9PSED|nr:GT4 family glycosyltransferase PelF [Pseudomonas mangrovi]PTU73532.1 glycosyl transferase family 1 [Pseudomonas mangrovi]